MRPKHVRLRTNVIQYIIITLEGNDMVNKKQYFTIIIGLLVSNRTFSRSELAGTCS
jgi:hypothetical protein